MTYFFQKNKQRIAQWNPTRRAAPWGRGPIPQIVLHTFEWPANRSMLSAATYLLNRTTHGSYHTLAGGSSQRDILRLAPVTAETWHCVPSNNWASGVSATTYAANWNKLSSIQRRNFVHSMAYASYLLSQELIAIGKAPVPAKRISRSEAMRGVWGFTYHRTMDPGRRTDPAHPQDTFPWAEFLAEYNRLMGTSAPATPTVPTNDLERLLDMVDLDDIARAVWRYKNENLTSMDAYAILRQTHSRAGALPSLQQIREGQSLHAGKVHAAVRRELDADVVPQISNLVGAIGALTGGEAFDEGKLLAGVQESAEAGAQAGVLAAQDVLRDALIETLNELPDRDANEIADAVVRSIGTRFTEGEG